MLLNLNMSVAMNGLRMLILKVNGVHGVLSLLKGYARIPLEPYSQTDYFPIIFAVSMYQQFSATAPPDYGHTPLMGSLSAGPSTVAPQATTTAPPSHQKPPPLVATGDWAHELVQLARTAELKYVPRDILHLPRGGSFSSTTRPCHHDESDLVRLRCPLGSTP